MPWKGDPMKLNEKSSFDIIKSLFVILEYDRPEISLSGIHVLFLTECFYRHLPAKFQKKLDLEELKYGALFHDIGKIRIPKEILTKANINKFVYKEHYLKIKQFCKKNNPGIF